MQRKTLSVYSNGTGKYPNFATMNGEDGGVRRFIGWEESEPGVWTPKTEPEVINACAEYQRAVRQGDLIAADAVTAAACGVPFTTLKQS
jgi:hypothetical protein